MTATMKSARVIYKPASQLTLTWWSMFGLVWLYLIGGCMPSGEKTGKLTKDQLERFRKVMFTKPLKELSKEFELSVSQLCRIRSGQHWEGR